MCVYQEPISFCPKSSLLTHSVEGRAAGEQVHDLLPPHITDVPDACSECFLSLTAKDYAHERSPREKVRERERGQEKESERTETEM